MFTLNNPDNVRLPETWSDCKYLAYQLESGINGTPHLQGYVIFLKNKGLTALKKLEPRAHWERRRGSHAEARAYCTKGS